MNKMRKPTFTNERLKQMISDLRQKSEEKKSKLLARVADDLERPTRIRREVNLSRINRFTKEGEIIIVPGKVLGGGEIDHKITISAFKFSGSALDKLKKSGSNIVPLPEITNGKIEVKKIRIIG
jgi:large subunit ribosomal protein L18e